MGFGRIFLFGIFLFVLWGVMAASWTQDELGYVLTFYKGSVVHVPFILAVIMNCVCNAFMFAFDFVVFALRVLHVI